MKKQTPRKKKIVVNPSEYHPSVAELREKIHIPTTPENLLKATVRDVQVVHFTNDKGNERRI